MSVARTVRSALLGACALTLAAAMGCGGHSTAQVTGAVTFSGQPPPVKGLQISFIAADGRMASCVLRDDGTYLTADVPTGDVGVAFIFASAADIDAAKKAGPKLPKPGTSGDVPDLGPQKPFAANPVPVALRDASTSKVTFRVEGGKKNVFNYDIKP